MRNINTKPMNYDFAGWATRTNLRCSDGRTILKDAFKHHDGDKVPLVWNHQHNDPLNIIGHAILEHHDKGVYAYGYFNDTESAKTAKELLKHGDICALSIFANKLKQKGSNVLHGAIREVSLVLAGANPGAFIDSVIVHGEELEEAVIYSGEMIAQDHDIETLELSHSEDKKKIQNDDKKEATTEKEKGDEKMADEKNKNDKTIEDVFNTLTDEQKDAVYALVGMVAEDAGMLDEDEEDDEDMKHNLFDMDDNMYYEETLTHADQMDILTMAKNPAVGTLQNAISMYTAENDSLAHNFENIEQLFPDYKDTNINGPETITRDQGWVGAVMNKVEKSPISRIRTRATDTRKLDLLGKGYKKGTKKKEMPNLKLLSRTTDPQTVYVKDALHRDDIIDIVDFDVVMYQQNIMKMSLNEEIALAVMVGDGRDEGDEAKIHPTNIRPIWTDDELYTIHTDVDIKKAKEELQGTNTKANFGDNYIYAEAIITAALYSREQFNGSGTPDLYCTPHLLNVMLLARDLNGRRIYDSKADLATALNVNNIYTVEQFENKKRKTAENKNKKLLGIFVNLQDYRIGATKGGEITSFEQFDIDFNQHKYLMETRISGALTKPLSAIALEEEVTE